MTQIIVQNPHTGTQWVERVEKSTALKRVGWLRNRGMTIIEVIR